MKKIVITGGAGFVGSHIVDKLAQIYPGTRITVLDKMTYAADVKNIMHHIESGRIHLKVGDICHMETCLQTVKDADLVIHAAAESHVDNSFGNSLAFSETNVRGTHSLMEACRVQQVPKIIHFSTDEVYGEIISGKADEEHVLSPTNPYSASKAAADMIVKGYLKSFNLPVITIRANNIYGIRQFPEKIIPKFLLLAMQGKQMTIHGTGKNSRHFVSAADIADAIDLLVRKGAIGQCYNIGSEQEFQNIEIAHIICGIFGADPNKAVCFIHDRPFNDARYAVNWDKIKALGWEPVRKLRDDMPTIARWYMDNFERFAEQDEKIVARPK